MTTTDHTAHDVIARHMANRIIHEDPKGQAENIATEALAALTAAGYAVVRLPEATQRSDTWAWWNDAEWTVDSTDEGVVRVTAAGGNIYDPAVLRAFAAALLAAANHQENNQ